MDFRKIESFLKVADTMNISRAAEELHISHQGLSKQIRILEQELGANLLERGPSGIRLTEAGKKMNEWFRPIVSEANYHYNKLEEFVRVKKTTVNVGYFNALSYRQCVKPAIQFLEETQPSLKIDILATDIGMVRKFLNDDVIDIGITIMISEDDWLDVSYVRLFDFPMKIIVSERHPWYQLERISEQDMRGGSLLYYADGSIAFLENLEVKEHIPVHNFDTYIGRLIDGQEFGIVADIYSKREGEFRLFDLPASSQFSGTVIAAYKKEHPLRNAFNKISM